MPLTGGAAARGAHSSLDKMNPELRARLAAMWQNAPPEIQKRLAITSGFRDPNDPRIWELYKRSRGGMADPRRSPHGKGNAADLAGDLDYAHAHAKEYGLHWPVRGEAWHAQMDPRYRGPDFLDREADRSRLVGNTQDDEKRQNERNRLFDSAFNSGVLGGGPNLNGNAKLQIDLNGFPKGTKTQTQTDGIFTDVKLNRGRSMPLASEEE